MTILCLLIPLRLANARNMCLFSSFFFLYKCPAHSVTRIKLGNKPEELACSLHKDGMLRQCHDLRIAAFIISEGFSGNFETGPPQASSLSFIPATADERNAFWSFKGIEHSFSPLPISRGRGTNSPSRLPFNKCGSRRHQNNEEEVWYYELLSIVLCVTREYDDHVASTPLEGQPIPNAIFQLPHREIAPHLRIKMSNPGSSGRSPYLEPLPVGGTSVKQSPSPSLQVLGFLEWFSEGHI